jgi:hypothetical protein
MMARTDDSLREMRGEIKSGQAEIKNSIGEGVTAAVQSIRSEKVQTIQQRAGKIVT